VVVEQTMIAATKSRRRGASHPDLRHMDLEEIYQLAERLDGRPVPGVRMSEAEFEAWCDEDVRAEWVDGEVILMPPMNNEHSDLTLWLSAVVRMFIEEDDLGALRFDFFVRFASQRRRRVPDLLFISKRRLALIRPT